jgi:hypothetical protein
MNDNMMISAASNNVGASLLTFHSSDAKMIMMSVVIITTIAKIYLNVNNFTNPIFVLAALYDVWQPKATLTRL